VSSEFGGRAVSLRLDADGFAWVKEAQTRANQMLRERILKD